MNLATVAHLESNVEQSVVYLASEAARRSVEKDPYWPKWDSPWWHMTLLWELGMAARIPSSIVRTMISVLDRHYLKVFPIAESDLPPGVDPVRGTMCHCALGTMYQVLSACDVDVDRELPWARPWFLKYQMPDGGLNCDNDAYAKPTPKSSFVSTLPPLEAVLRCTPRSFTDAELRFLDLGADYLIKHRLFRRSDSDAIVDEAWLKLTFPRFYEYDVLRGLSFLIEWAALRQVEIPESAIADGRRVIRDQLERADSSNSNEQWKSGWGKSLFFPVAGGKWEKREPELFPLLSAASEPSTSKAVLKAKWKRISP